MFRQIHSGLLLLLLLTGVGNIAYAGLEKVKIVCDGIVHSVWLTYPFPKGVSNYVHHNLPNFITQKDSPEPENGYSVVVNKERMGVFHVTLLPAKSLTTLPHLVITNIVEHLSFYALLALSQTNSFFYESLRHLVYPSLLKRRYHSRDMRSIKHHTPAELHPLHTEKLMTYLSNQETRDYLLPIAKRNNPFLSRLSRHNSNLKRTWSVGESDVQTLCRSARWIVRLDRNRLCSFCDLKGWIKLHEIDDSGEWRTQPIYCPKDYKSARRRHPLCRLLTSCGNKILFRIGNQLALYDSEKKTLTERYHPGRGVSQFQFKSSGVSVWNCGVESWATAVMIGIYDTVTATMPLSHRHFVVALAKGDMRIYALNRYSSYQRIGLLKGHSARINCWVHLKNHWIVTGSRDRTVRLWNLDPVQDWQASDFIDHFDWDWPYNHKHWENELFTTDSVLLGRHNLAIVDIIQLTDGRILSSSEDATIKLWDLTDPPLNPVMTISTGSRICFSLAELPDGKIACCNDEEDILVLDLFPLDDEDEDSNNKE